MVDDEHGHFDWPDLVMNLAIDMKKIAVGWEETIRLTSVKNVLDNFVCMDTLMPLKYLDLAGHVFVGACQVVVIAGDYFVVLAQHGVPQRAPQKADESLTEFVCCHYYEYFAKAVYRADLE